MHLLVEIALPWSCVAGHGDCSKSGHGHDASIDDPQLSEEAKQWMIDHPVRSNRSSP